MSASTSVATTSSSPTSDNGTGQRPVKVLHVITRMIVGGAQENTLLSVEGLDAMDRYDVTLVSGVDDGPEGELLSRARRTTRLIVIPELGRSISPRADLVALWKLYRLMRRERYDIVHTHSSKAGVLGRIAAYLAGTPIIVHTLHSLVFHDYQPRAVNLALRLVKRALAPITDHYISVSRLIAERAIAAGIGSPEKYTTIYSGMELDWFLSGEHDGAAVRQEFGIPPDAPVVGKIARLFKLKGHDELLDAVPEVVARHPDVRFLLVGDGILQEHLRGRCEGMGVADNVVFGGLIDRERIPEMIAAMDVLVHTSLREGLARVLPQALAMGKPCVAFDLDGSPEVVLPGQTGYLVKAGDAPVLAASINQLLDDPKLRETMGCEGRRHVDPAFRAETMVAQIADVYEHLIADHQPRSLSRFRRFPVGLQRAKRDHGPVRAAEGRDARSFATEAVR
jgi:glycosyltransferase involved in cell wall biosynthesis